MRVAHLCVLRYQLVGNTHAAPCKAHGGVALGAIVADDVDDVLSSGQVIGYVENQSNLNLANSTTVGGNSIVTSATTLQPDWNNIQNKPAGFLDDIDNVLSPSEVESLLGNCKKAKRELKWKPKYDFHKLVEDMVKADLEFVEKEGY